MVIEDDSPAGLSAGMLFSCGITPKQVHASTTNLFHRHEDMRNSCFNQLNVENHEISAFNRNLSLLEHGIEWFLEPLRETQPKTYRTIINNNAELWSGFRICNPGFPIDRVIAQSDSYLFTNGRAYHIDPYNPGMSPYERGSHSSELKLTFPNIFLDAWLSRVAGWQLIRQIPRPVLPHAGPLWHPALWSTIDTRLNSYGKSFKKKYLPRFKSYFGEEGWQHSLGTYQFVCFLDTRVPDGFSKSGTTDKLAGDQFFIHLGRTDRCVYHIHQGNLETLRFIPTDDLAEAFDGYFSHLFSRSPGEYNFMPYSRVQSKI